MSGLDVLATLSLAEQALTESGKQHRAVGDAGHGNMATRAAMDMTEARAAVAELVEADRALDAVKNELPCDMDAPAAMDPAGYISRLRAAQARRDAALAKFGVAK